MNLREGLRPLAAGALAIGTAVASLGLLSSAPGDAQAVSYNPVEGNSGFLLMTEGDALLAGDESEGAAAIGGDLSFGPYNVMLGSSTAVAPGDEVPIALLVRGQVDLGASAGSLQVLDGAYAKVGDPTGVDVRSTDDNDADANTRIQPVGTPYGTTPNIALSISQPEDSVTEPVPTDVIDFDAAFADFRSRSTELGACPNDVQLLNRDDSSPIPDNDVPPGTPVRIELVEGEQNVLSIDAEDLANISEMTFDDRPSADTPLLVNVDTSGVGDEFDWVTPSMAGTSSTEAPFILWNFPTATRVTFPPGGDSIEGTIYAPNALVQLESGHNIEGNVIADTFEHTMPGGGTATAEAAAGAEGSLGVRELHDFGFAAELTPCGDVPPPTTTTSEPDDSTTTTVPDTTTTVPDTTTTTVPDTTTTTVPDTTTTTVPDSTTTVPDTTTTVPDSTTTVPDTTTTTAPDDSTTTTGPDGSTSTTAEDGSTTVPDDSDTTAEVPGGGGDGPDDGDSTGGDRLPETGGGPGALLPFGIGLALLGGALLLADRGLRRTADAQEHAS